MAAESTDAANLNVNIKVDGTEQLDGATAATKRLTGALDDQAKSYNELNSAALAETRARIQERNERNAMLAAAEKMISVTRDGAEATAQSGVAASGAAAGLGSYAIAAVGVGTALAATLKFLNDSVDAWKTAEQSHVRLANMLSVLGSSAGRTQEQLEGLAEELQRATVFDDESIIDATSALLKFQGVSGETLDRAVRMSADLATVMGTDVRSAAETVGRALENSYGTAMLRRMGLLTDAQVEYLRALKAGGDEAGYQSEVLRILEERMGGIAEKSQGIIGAQRQMMNAIGDTMELVGKYIASLTGLQQRFENIAKVLNSLNANGGEGWGALLTPQLPFGGGTYDYRRDFGIKPGYTYKPGDDLSDQVSRSQQQADARDYRQLADNLTKTNELIKAYESLTKSKRTLADVTKEVTALWDAEDKATGRLHTTFGTLDNAIKQIAEATLKKEKAVRGSSDADKEAKQQAQEFSKVLDYLSTRFNGVSKEQQAYNEALAALAKAEQLATAMGEPMAHVIAKQAEEVAKLNPETIAQAKAREEYAKASEKSLDAMTKETGQLEKQAEKLEEQNKLLGVSKEYTLRYAAAQYEAEKALALLVIAQLKSLNESPQEIAALEKKIETLNRLIAATNDAASAAGAADAAAAASKGADAWTKKWDQITQSLTDALMRGFEGGKGFAENFRDTLVNLFKTLVLRPSIEFIVKGALGGIGSMFPSLASAFGGGGGGAGGLGGLGGLGDLASLFSIFGGIGSVGAAGPIVPTFLSGLLGGITSPISTMGAALFGEAGVLGGTLATLGSVIGAALPIIGIGLAVAGMFGAFDRGGPKKGGYASTPGLDLGPIFAGDNNRYFTPNDADKELMKIVTATTKSYKDYMKLLGGKAGDFSFALGYDTDPEGTASNRAHIGAWVNGRQVYDYRSGDDSLGRDSAALQEAIDLETKRALLAAIQASDLPEAIANILNEVTAATASEEQITNILALGQAYKQIDELFKKDPMEEALKAFEPSTKVFERMGAELRNLLETFDGTAESTQTLQDATVAYWNALVNLLAQIEQVRRNISESVEQSRRDIALAIAPDEKARYNLYDEWYSQAMGYLGRATDPESINRYANQAQSNLMNAFALLTPEQQRRLAPDFLRNLDTIEEIANRQLEEARKAAQEQAEAIGEAVKKAIEDAAKKIGDGGEAVKTGGQNVLDAAKLFVNAAGRVDLAADKIANQTIVVEVVGAGTTNGLG